MIQRKMFFVLSRAWEKDKIQSPHELSGRVSERESEGLRFISSWGLRIFSLYHARDKTKNISLFLTELKTYHISHPYFWRGSFKIKNETKRLNHCGFSNRQKRASEIVQIS